MSRSTVHEPDGTVAVDDVDSPDDESQPTAFDQYGTQVFDEMDLAVVEANKGLIWDEVPSVDDRQREARMAVQKSTQQLVGHNIVMVKWRPQTALLANTGEMTDGFFCVGVDLDTKETFSVFIGGIALVRTLRNVRAPMRARIEQKGRTLVWR